MTAEQKTSPWAIGKFGAWYLVCVLTLCSMLSYWDRSGLGLVLNPMKADLGLSDTQLSLLFGVVFVLFYSAASIPMGYLADILNRRVLLMCAVAFWSTMTVLFGMSTSFLQLGLFRAGLGLGEAALQPSAVSLIRDAFPAEKRARAFSIYSMGPPVGAAVALLVGGFFYGLAEGGSLSHLPVIGELHPWRFTVLVPGLIGIPILIFLLFMREPSRPVAVDSKPPATGFGDVWVELRKRRHVYGVLAPAIMLAGMAGGGWSGWFAAAVARVWDLTPQQVGQGAGPALLIGTISGLTCLGFVIDRQVKRAGAGAAFRVAAWALTLQAPFALTTFLGSGPQWAFIAYGFDLFFAGATSLAYLTTLSYLAPSSIIGKLIAVIGLIYQMLGLSLGPTVVAMVSDQFFEGPHAIAWAMMCCYAGFTAGAIILMHVTSRRVTQMLEDEKV